MSDPRKSYVCEQDVKQAQRVLAKCKLTTLQYLGGPHMTTCDHIKICTILLEVFGDYSVGVPIHATGEWGFKQWANHITHGRW